MRRDGMHPGEPPRRLTLGERALVHAATLAAGLSGALLFAVKHLLPAPEDPFTAWNHPSQPYLLHVHVLAGPVVLFAIGWIARDHVLRRLRDRARRRARRSGMLATLLLLPMIVSGYLLQVVTGEGARNVLVWAHVASGLAFLGSYVAHLLVARWTAAAAIRPVTEGLASEPLHLRVAAGLRRGGLLLWRAGRGTLPGSRRLSP